jgi:predicted Ser/Thr protein kinase
MTMHEKEEALKSLRIEIERKEKRIILSFDDFLELVRRDPERVLRNIFQLFNDMVRSYVIKGKDEYPDDPESIGFVEHDCSKLFVEGMDNPFFVDRLFANRFVRQVELLRQGSQQNKIHVFKGPHGCGKSTFMNNLLKAFEHYTDTREGQSFEIFWEINVNQFSAENGEVSGDSKIIEVPCPSHDHPLLIIPKNYRVDFLDKLLSKDVSEDMPIEISAKMAELRYKISHEKEYEWVFKEEACTICKSLFWSLFNKLGSVDKVLSMVKVRTYQFDRRLGEGISVFNPGDRSMRENCLSDRQIQEKLNQIFGANLVKYVFSPHAKTNNGIYVLMDIKGDNKERLFELHNVISEGVHKVDGIEERINSLIFVLMNPEDQEDIAKEKMKSLQERMDYKNVSYVMETGTEVKIYRSIFGEHINEKFLPKVLENFARIIISSRMNINCNSLKGWIENIKKYEKYCDENGLLLRMEIYSGIIPPWLLEEDKKTFTAQVRRRIIAEAENEGQSGFSGRESVEMFGEFISRYNGKSSLINMKDVTMYFKHRISKDRRDCIPPKFIDSLVNWYDYTVLNEVKEALYFYNKEQIKEDILHYLCAVNYDLNSRAKCQYTGKEIEVTIDFFKLLGSYITGKNMFDNNALSFARDVQRRYIEIIAQDRNKEITETELYQELFDSYVRNLKEKVLQPFIRNDNFREAIKLFGTEEFKIFDTKLRERVAYMIKNLIEKFGYTEQGAKEICLYVLDKKLAENF